MTKVQKVQKVQGEHFFKKNEQKKRSKSSKSSRESFSSPPTKEKFQKASINNIASAKKPFDLCELLLVRVSQTLKPFTPLCRKCQEADMAPKHSTLKRPAAALSIKSEPKSPKVPKRQPEMAAESPPPEKPEVAAESPPPEKPEVAAVEKAEMSAGPTGADKPVVAKGRTRKPKNGELPAPGKEAWKDVHTQVMKLQKQGKGALRNASSRIFHFLGSSATTS